MKRAVHGNGSTLGETAENNAAERRPKLSLYGSDLFSPQQAVHTASLGTPKNGRGPQHAHQCRRAAMSPAPFRTGVPALSDRRGLSLTCFAARLVVVEARFIAFSSIIIF